MACKPSMGEINYGTFIVLTTELGLLAKQTTGVLNCMKTTTVNLETQIER